MILATFTIGDGGPTLGAVDRAAGIIVDLQAVAIAASGAADPAMSGMLDLIRGGDEGLERARLYENRAKQSGLEEALRPLDAATLLAPLPLPEQIRDFSVFELHMRQAAVGVAKLRAARTGSGDPLPRHEDIRLPPSFYEQPIYYKGNRFNLVGQDADVHWPSYCNKFDYELEFAAVIGRRGKNITREDAAKYIFGYTIFNDFSARDAQEIEMTCPFGPAKGKDFDRGSAMGPWIVTPDELPDPRNLTMAARINGREWSRGSSATMIHGFEDMIAHVSRDETIHPGEIFGSGTVGGGCGLELDRWLSPDDVVELEVEGIGMLRNRVVRHTS